MAIARTLLRVDATDKHGNTARQLAQKKHENSIIAILDRLAPTLEEKKEEKKKEETKGDTKEHKEHKSMPGWV